MLGELLGGAPPEPFSTHMGSDAKWGRCCVSGTPYNSEIKGLSEGGALRRWALGGDPPQGPPFFAHAWSALPAVHAAWDGCR